MSEIIASTTPLPVGGTVHARATVTNTAGTLASFLASSVLPTKSVTVGTQTKVLQATGVSLGIESAESTSKVYFTSDGQTPTAALGGELPLLPVMLWFPLGNTGLGSLKLLGSVATVHVQAIFEFRG